MDVFMLDNQWYCLFVHYIKDLNTFFPVNCEITVLYNTLRENNMV